MQEYALILAAVAVVVFVGYQTMGTTVQSLLTQVDGSLGAAGIPTNGYWNAWIADMYTEDANASPVLTENKLYILNFDLSAFLYKHPRQSVSIDHELAKVLNSFGPKVPSVSLRVMPVISGPSVRFLSARKPPDRILIDLDLLRRPRSPQAPNEGLASFASRTRAGSIPIFLQAVQPGCSTVSVSIWNEVTDRPVDNIGLRLAVAGPDGKVPACSSPDQTNSFYGKLGSLLDNEPGHRVDAALYVFEIDDQEVAVFKAQGMDFLHWKLNQSILENIDNPAALPSDVAWANEHSAYASLYLKFTDDLFSASDPSGDAEAHEALRQIRSIATGKAHPSLFGRLVDSRGAPFMLPLGLIALDDSGTTPLGSRCRILQPLPEDQIVSKAKCIGTWRLVLPQLIIDPNAPNDANSPPLLPISSLQSDSQADRIRNVTTWPEFYLYMNSVLSSSGSPELGPFVPQTPEGLLLLAHQNREVISFVPGVPPKAQANELKRSYAPGSIAFLFICGTGLFDFGHGNLGASWIYHLNHQGISTVVVAPFAIPKSDGAALAQRLAAAISRLDPAKGLTSLSEMWPAAFEDSSNVSGDADLNILSEFVIAGESDVKFCGR